MRKLLDRPSLEGLAFLDVGCGSGLHALAALRLGAAQVTAVDLDPHSVATARALLKDQARCTVLQADALHLPPTLGRFDVVYSWGVLHHTGHMHRAIRAVAGHVKPGGLLALALYGKTPYCGLWTRIKRWYVRATPSQRARAERLYIRAYGAYLLLRGKRLSAHIAEYHRKRGMDFYHDVRDWIGGYPYESIRPGELRALLEPLGFTLAQQNVRRRSGLFGSGNDEFLFQRTADSP